MELTSEFLKYYPDEKNVQTTFCPYRICPMGAHSDHQFGKVTGIAIDKGIEIAYTPTSDGIIEAASLNYDGTVTFDLKRLPGKKKNDWADYIRGAAVCLSTEHELKTGIKALISGGLPIGGLSSSAAVIIAFLKALCNVNGIVLSEKELINVALRSETEYVGISVGTLDQSCEVYCKKDHLLYLDTKDGSYELIPASKNMPDYEIAVFFSGLQRTLVGSKFNMRVDEMRAAGYSLMAFAGMEYDSFKETKLRFIPREVYDSYKNRLPENFAKRAEHFYSEFARVEKGAEMWRRGDIEGFGKLSFESCESSINNYEVGSPELIAIYRAMRETQGIYGGRFSGAGFKGCCMALIDPRYEDVIKEEITRKYLTAFPQYKDSFSVHFCHSTDGVKYR